MKKICTFILFFLVSLKSYAFTDLDELNPPFLENEFMQFHLLKTCNSDDGQSRSIYYCLRYEKLDMNSGYEENYYSPSYGSLIKNISQAENENIELLNKLDNAEVISEGTGKYLIIDIDKKDVNKYCTPNKNFDLNLFPIDNGLNGSYSSFFRREECYSCNKSPAKFGNFNAISYADNSRWYDAASRIDFPKMAVKHIDYVRNSASFMRSVFGKKLAKKIISDEIPLLEALDKKKINIKSVKLYVTQVKFQYYTNRVNLDLLKEQRHLNLFNNVDQRSFCNIEIDHKDHEKKNWSGLPNITTNAINTSTLLQALYKNIGTDKVIESLKNAYLKRSADQKKIWLEKAEIYSDNNLIKLARNQNDLISASEIKFEETYKYVRPIKGEFEKTADYKKRLSDSKNKITYTRNYGYYYVGSTYNPDTEMLVYDIPFSNTIDTNYKKWTDLSGEDFFGKPVNMDISFQSRVELRLKTIPMDIILGAPKENYNRFDYWYNWSSTTAAGKEEAIEFPMSIEEAKKNKHNLKSVIIFEYDDDPSNREIDSEVIRASKSLPTLKYKNLGKIYANLIGLVVINTETNKIMYVKNTKKDIYHRAISKLDERNLASGNYDLSIKNIYPEGKMVHIKN